jgi:hypothetical protein
LHGSFGPAGRGSGRPKWSQRQTPEPDGSKDPDQVKAEQQRSDRLPQSVTVPDDAGESGVSANQDASFDQRESALQTGESNRAEKPLWRRAVTADNVSAAGTFGSAINTVAQFSMHATPEGMASLGLMMIGLAAFVLGKVEKHRKEKDDRDN